MIEYELDDDIIKSIVQTIISYYKIKEESANIIYDMIKFKGIKDAEIKKKYYKNLELSVINEKEGEDNEILNENIKNDENINEKNEEEKEEEEDSENKINRELIENVNQTLPDEVEDSNDDEDINKKMIKSFDEDELNAQMIKDIDDEEIEENENNKNIKDKEKD